MQDADPSGNAPTVRAHEERAGAPLRVSWRSHAGRVRHNNEDALLVLSTQFEQGDDRQCFGVFAVADGMGGHEHGEKASAMAVRTVADELSRRVMVPLLGGGDGGSPPPLGETMRSAVVRAHHRMRRELPGSGSTLTAAVVIGDNLAVAHVGDSRAYLAHGGSITQLTRDHSVLARMVEEGHPPIADDVDDPRRSVLYRALGQGQSNSIDVDFQFHAFPPGSRLLLCSDGLWGVLAEGELELMLSTAVDGDLLCEELVDRANEVGGPDNITVVLVIRPGATAGSQPPPPAPPQAPVEEQH